MATGGKPYDATFKTLLCSAPSDRLRFVGIAVGTAPVTILDADLSSISIAADGLFQVAAEMPPEAFLNAGLSLVPLTLLGDVSATDAPSVVEWMRTRIVWDAHDQREERELLAATYLLTGAK